jgi:ACS family 4-hydroxyphenylacetate permease-like MFS transporter
MGMFWTIPAPLLSNETRPLSLAFINTVGLLASAATPAIIGILRDMTGNFAVGTYYDAFMLGVAAVLILLVTANRRALLR